MMDWLRVTSSQSIEHSGLSKRHPSSSWKAVAFTRLELRMGNAYFIGKILSSRGIRASYSLSFLEVVVACDVVDNESSSTSRDDGADYNESLEEKQKVGDIVCVSGKVRIMRSKNHYEMREYNMDVLQDEKDPSFCAQRGGRISYPSKEVLPSNIDPIPEDLAHDFGLLCLHD
ncbi:hypothetical protein HAX54_013582, partial [Datura stramonium]|nr:hypothetical protein [Datura stramonium]